MSKKALRNIAIGGLAAITLASLGCERWRTNILKLRGVSLEVTQVITL